MSLPSTAAPPQIIVILGKRRSGKTSLMRRMMSAESRTIALDPGHELPGALVTSDLFRAKRYVRHWAQSEFTVSYRPTKPGADAEVPFAHDFEHLVDLAGEASVHGEVLLVADESQFVGDARKPSRALQNTAMFGAHWGAGVRLIAATRRPAEMPRALTSQADVFWVFRQHEVSDVAYVERSFGHLRVDGTDTTVVDAMRDLGPHGCIQIDTRTDAVRIHNHEEQKENEK